MRLVLRNVSIRRGARALVDDLSWSAAPGAIHWVVGDNGDGKSSLLRVLAGREPADAGDRRVEGIPAGSEIRYYNPRMGLPPGRTVGEWRRLRAILGLPERSGVDDLLPARVGADQRLDQLSTGEAKRLLLHSLLARASALTILDEPYEHLSPPAKAALSRHLAARALETIVVVATNQERPPGVPARVLDLDALAGAGAGTGPTAGGAR